MLLREGLNNDEMYPTATKAKQNNFNMNFDDLIESIKSPEGAIEAINQL